jgi:putative phosphoesterase
MIKIALISDNHSYIGEDIMKAVEDCDEIWHAGDIGDRKSLDPLIKGKTFIAVYGNIDTTEVQDEFPEFQIFDCGGIKVMMTHIGGYPGRYNKNTYHKLLIEKPDLFISGHSHILRVMRDNALHLLHMNPGSYGYTGFHHVRTLLKFDIENQRIQNVRVVELGPRNQKP